MTSARNARHVGLSPCGVAVVTLVIRSSRRCGRMRPVRRSTTPPGVLSAQTSASHSSAVDACLGSERAIFSTDEIVAELASLPVSRGLSALSDAIRQIPRAR